MKDRPDFVLALGAPSTAAHKLKIGGDKMAAEDDSAPSPEEHGEVEKAAMRAFLDAVKADDAVAAVDAFHDLCDLHSDAYEGDEDTDSGMN